MEKESDVMKNAQIWELPLKVTSQEMAKHEVKSEEGKNQQRRVDGGWIRAEMNKSGKRRSCYIQVRWVWTNQGMFAHIWASCEMCVGQ